MRRRPKLKKVNARKLREEPGKRSENACKDMKDGVENVWDEMSGSIEKAAARFK